MKKTIDKIKQFIGKHRKASVITAIVLIVIIIGLIFFGTMDRAEDNKSKKKTEETRAITAEGLIREDRFEGLVFNNVMLIKKGDMYTLTMDVRNETANEIDIPQVDVDMIDKNGNTLITLLGYIGEKMQPNETRTITSSTQVDLTKVKDKKIYIKTTKE